MVEVVETSGRGTEPRPDHPLDDVVGDARTAIHVDRAEHGLQRVGQDRRLLPPAGGVLATPQQQELTEPEPLRHVGQGECVHDTLADTREITLGKLAEPAVGKVGNDPPEDRIAEELEPLVAQRAWVLGAPRPVGHGAFEQRRIGELVANAQRQRMVVARGPVSRHRSVARQAPPRVRSCT